MTKNRSSRLVAFVAVFAAIDVILSAIPGWWISWAAVIKPLHGIFLGPLGGALADVDRRYHRECFLATDSRSRLVYMGPGFGGSLRGRFAR